MAGNFKGEQQGSQLCGLCQRVRPTYVRAVSHGPYEGALRDLIHLLKYERVQSAADTLGSSLAQVLRQIAAETGTDPIVIPVPLHSSKLRQRGFNQAERIAKFAQRELRRDFAFELQPGALQRKRATTSQTGLTRHQRRENVRGAFAVSSRFKSVIAGRNVILVDDVFTTGTTAEECSRVLMRAGAKRVWVATVARVSKIEGILKFEGRQFTQEEAASFAPGNAFDGES